MNSWTLVAAVVVVMVVVVVVAVAIPMCCVASSYDILPLASEYVCLMYHASTVLVTS